MKITHANSPTGDVEVERKDAPKQDPQRWE